MVLLALSCIQSAIDAQTAEETGGEGEPRPELCDTAMRTTPEPGADDHFYRDPVRLWFTGDPGEVTVTLTDSVGMNLPGTLVLSDEETTFTPETPLAPSADYTLSIDYCGGLTSLGFTTSDFGDPVDPSTLPGRTWTFNLMSGDFIQPDASGVLTTFTMGEGYLLTVLEADEDTLTLHGGRAEFIDGEWLQDHCAPTVDLSHPLDFTANPFATLSSDSIEIGWMTMQEATISGAFSADSTQLAGLHFLGSVHVSAMSRSFWELNLTDSEACGLLEGFGLLCEDCPDDSGPYCLTYELIGVTGDETVPLEPRTEAEVALDPECLGQ